MSSSKPREGRHIRLYHWLMRSAAWQNLDCVARATYVEIASRYSGTDDKGFSNNGRIPMSLKELAGLLHISKQTAMRALGALVDHGFLVVETKGRFTTGYRTATEYRLTEFPCNGHMPTKDFMKWQNSKAGSTTKPIRVSTWNGSGVETEQVPDGNRPYGSATKPDDEKPGSTTKPLLVYQGEKLSGEAALPVSAAPVASEPPKASAPRRGQAGDFDLPAAPPGPIHISEALKLSPLVRSSGGGRHG